MQRSIYTISKANLNDFGYKPNPPSKRTVSTTNDLSLQTMVRNRNFTETYMNKQMRKQHKIISPQVILNNKQSFRLKPASMSPSPSTIKNFEQKNFIKENIANVSGNSNQFKYRNLNKCNGNILKRSIKDDKDDLSSFINQKIGKRDIHLTWPEDVTLRNKRPSRNALSLYEFYKNTWSNCHIPGETSIHFVHSKMHFKDGYYFNQ